MAKPRVLVVDDVEVFREIMAELLAERGYAVYTARDGLEALEILKNQNFDLVLLDLLLPKMTGFDVLRELRAAPQTQALPVLAVSGVFRWEDHMMSLRELGATGFVSKSLSPAEIADRVIRTLSGAEPTPAQASAGPPPSPEPALDPRDAVARMHLFHQLAEAQREKIIAISRRVKFFRGQVILQEGEEGDQFYGILAGRVRVEKRDPSGQSTIIARLGAGDGFGELALVDREKRSATCLAEEEVEALEISRPDFERALATDPDLERKCLRALLKILTSRLRDTDATLTFSRSLLEKMIEQD